MKLSGKIYNNTNNIIMIITIIIIIILIVVVIIIIIIIIVIIILHWLRAVFRHTMNSRRTNGVLHLIVFEQILSEPRCVV